MKVDRQLLETRADAAELFEPADALLDDRPTPIGLFVERHGRVPARQFVVLVRDHRLDFLPLDPIAQARDAVPLVAGELFRLVPAFASLSPTTNQAGDRLADHRLGTGAFVHLSGG